MSLPLAKTSRMEWGVPLSWARNYPDWPNSLRRWLARARAEGLTQIIAHQARNEVALIALPPGEKWDGFYGA